MSIAIVIAAQHKEGQKRATLNAQAKHIPYCALFAYEFNRNSSCVTVKDIWDRLLLTFEGTERVKEIKMNILLGNYELFKMKFDETATQIFIRFAEIVNDPTHQGKISTYGEKVIKLPRALPKEWSYLNISIKKR